MENISGHFIGLKGGLLMSVISFSIVFLVCIGLMLMMVALKHFTAAIERRKNAENEEPRDAGRAPASPASVVVSAVPGEEEELVAVITAAVMASCGERTRILSISPAPPRAVHSAWRIAGRIENFS